jgi:hypothetical protein
LKAGLKYHASGLLVLSIQNIMFLKFEDEKLLKAIKEDFKLELLIKKIYEINNKGNKIRNNFITSIK